MHAAASLVKAPRAAARQHQVPVKPRWPGRGHAAALHQATPYSRIEEMRAPGRSPDGNGLRPHSGVLA
jgi:hypothetical protein